MHADTERLAALLTHLGGPRVGRMPLCLLMLLWQRRGTVVGYERILDYLEASRPPGYTADQELVRGSTKKLRKAIRKNGWPIDITTYNSIGLRLAVTDPDWSLDPP